jgi:hypothetical protein
MKYLNIHKHNYYIFKSAQNNLDNNLDYYVKNRLLFEKAVNFSNLLNIDHQNIIDINIDFNEIFDRDYDNMNDILFNESLFIYGTRNNILLKSIEWCNTVKR